MRIGEIYVAAPDPAAALLRFGADQAGGLRIMDHEQVFSKLHALAVLLIVRHEDVSDLLGQVVVAAVQRVMEALGDLIEVIAAGDDVPARGNFQLIHERDQAVENFSHAAANGG